MKRPHKYGSTEAQLHRAVAQYLNLALPADCWWTTFPSGGGGKVRGAQLKAMGLKAGVPDILIVRDGQIGPDPRVYWIKLKTPTGVVSPEQRRLHITLGTFGCLSKVCRSVAAVEGALLDWGIKPKASVKAAGRRAA